jgi:hypothetical protein
MKKILAQVAVVLLSGITVPLVALTILFLYEIFSSGETTPMEILQVSLQGTLAIVLSVAIFGLSYFVVGEKS